MIAAQPATHTLWSKQTDLVRADDQFVLFVAGVGSGKTVAGAARALNAAFGFIGDKKVIPTPNWGMVTAPTYSMLEDGPIPTFRSLASRFEADYNVAKQRIIMSNGSVILFRSTEKIDRRRGSNLSWWWGDESAMYRATVWKTMIARLREHRQLGYGWLTTSPKGRDWQWQKFERQRARGFRIIRAATWENPFVDENYVRNLIIDYGGLDSDFARQEILGEFIAHQGLIYSMFSADLHVTTKVRDRYSRVEAGVDWGFRNPGVIEVGGVTEDGRLDILHEEYKKGRDIDQWVETALELKLSHNIEKFHCDPSRPDYIAAFRSAGLDAVGANNDVISGINAVKRRLNKRTLRIHEGAVWLIKEMQDLYQWAKERGELLPEVPVKAHDHACDALKYLVRGLDEPTYSAAPEMDVRRVL